MVVRGIIRADRDREPTIEVPVSLIRNAIVALRYVAHNEAGQSQKPLLISKESTQEWDDAATLEAIIKDQP